MSRNSAGTYTAPSNSVNPAVEGAVIDETDFNALVDDLEAALTESLSISGKGKVTHHIDFDATTVSSPAANVGRVYVKDVGGVTSLFFKDSAGTDTNLLLSSPGLAFTFSTTTTMADPGSGLLRFNNATISSVTAIAIDDNDANGADISNYILSWDDVSAANRGTLIIQNRTSPGNVAIFTVSGASTDNAGWTQLAVTYVTHAGSFGSSAPLGVTFAAVGSTGAAGGTGATGAAGTDPGIRWAFASSTTMADPSAGNVRLNNATLASVTAAAVSASSGETGNPSVLAFLQAWDDSTTTANRGTLIIKKASAPQNFAIYKISGALTDNTTWVQLVLTHVASSGSFSASDVLAVQFERTGDKGADGAGSFTSLSPGAGTTSDVTANAPGSAITTSGTLSAAELVNAQTGTTYTIVDGDRAKLVTLSNAASIAVTLPQAGQATTFKSGWFTDVANLGSSVATITPTTSTINGAATFVLNRFQSIRIVSDGTNYQVVQGASLRGQTVTVASSSTCDIGTTASHRVSITGTTTITSLGTVPNQIRFATFSGALTLTYNATTLILPGAASITTAAGDAGIFSSDASGNWTCLAYTKANGQAVVGGSGGSSPTKGHLSGLTLSNSGVDATNDIVIATGVAADLTSGTIMDLTSGLTKQLDAAWAVGSNAGGLDTGSIANTTYHVWLIRRSDTGVVDALFSTSASAPTMPTNYDQKRRIGSIVRTGATIKAFSQIGDEFLWKAAVADINAANPGTAAVSRTLTVPIGIQVRALMDFGCYTGSSGDARTILSSLDQNDENITVNFNGGASAAGGHQFWQLASVRTNTSAQIRTRNNASGASEQIWITTFGWIDTRDR